MKNLKEPVGPSENQLAPRLLELKVAVKNEQLVAFRKRIKELGFTEVSGLRSGALDTKMERED